MSTHEALEPSPDAATVVRQMIMGFRLTQLIYVAATLGIADHLRPGPQLVPAIAAAVGADAVALRRLLRALASVGIFSETGDGAFQLTSLAQPLLSDTPGSLRGLAILYGEDWLWRAYGQMLSSVQNGRPAFDQVHGQSFYAYLEERPEAAMSFQQAMTGYSDQEAAALLAAYDFAGLRQVVDVGGGQGALLAALLQAHPRLSGILFDRPPVVAEAEQRLARAGVTDRCTCVGGDFFAAAPAGGDAYVLKSVLHNWDDAASIRILRSCCTAMRADGRVLVVERVLPPGNAPAEAKLFDINMLVVTGGCERSEAEYRALFAAAGLALTRAIPTQSPLTIVEGVRP